jgi:hypothetical protein
VVASPGVVVVVVVVVVVGLVGLTVWSGSWE